ncbi:hypothetical protein J5N97_025125 [Dioscorea zingiberensis]|uniref:Uncharacterized protein n=1 Tax=Dioscorea zingiberensis TaxID=325984 RepID=A0A9D5H9Q6_9LILI|nr:hypothetical protein J5N97_025125 [Dioscorea zingiberensis]
MPDEECFRELETLVSWSLERRGFVFPPGSRLIISQAASFPFQLHIPNQSPNPSLDAGDVWNSQTTPQKPRYAPPGSCPQPLPTFNPSRLGSSPQLQVAKKRKLPEKQLPDRVAALLPESALYTQLLEFEARVDAALTRKKFDIQESLKSPPSLQRTLRIYVFNTFANQTPRTAESKNLEPPTWSLKIVGRILEDGVDPDPASGLPKPNPMYPKFSSFFKRITIALDPTLYPDNPTIIWEHARSPAPHEGFEVKRKGDKEFTVSIRFDMNYNPEKFRLSPPLMEVLGIEVDTRARVIAGIWQKRCQHFLQTLKNIRRLRHVMKLFERPIKKIHEHRRRRAFFLGFSQSPVEFINALIASQSRDLKLVAGDSGRHAEKERRSDFYNQPWVEDAVIRYLNRKPAGGNDGPGGL